jgi:hypothetical protein
MLHRAEAGAISASFSYRMGAVDPEPLSVSRTFVGLMCSAGSRSAIMAG